MIGRIFQKMCSNLKMVLCLLTGIILAVAMMSSIPVYTDGVLQRMLTRDMENFQNADNEFPGTYSFYKQFIDYKKQDYIKKFNEANDLITKNYFNELNVSSILSVCEVTDQLLNAVDETMMGPNASTKNITVEALSDFDKHVEIVQGSMFSAQKVNGVYEAVVSEKAIKEKNLLVGRTYIMRNSFDVRIADYLKVKIVGVYTYKNENDPYWYQGNWERQESFIIDFDLFMNEFMQETLTDLTSAQWYYALDYHTIHVKQLPAIVNTIENQTKAFSGIYDYNSVLPVFDILNDYMERAKVLKIILLVLQIPILLMVLFYLFMVSQLMIDRDKNEIAVLKSRGYSRMQLITGYIIEGFILSGIGMIIGPGLGLMICKFIGASNGFLEFVQRKKLPVFLNLKAYEYALLAILFFMITMLIPAILATGNTIVNYKQKNTRKINSTLWKKFYLDIVLLGVSLYGLYAYRSRLSILKIADVNGTDIPIDPLLFCISTLFILALGMFFLRIFPYLVRLISWSGEKYLGPVGYISLINVGRSGAQDQFLMLFLILTISLGIFNANSARTINTNTEEKERYKYGADMVLQPKWESSMVPAMPMIPGASQQSSADTAVPKPVIYIEPPYLPFTRLKGVESAAKVFKKEDIDTVVNGKFTKDASILGIEPYDFGRTAWFRSDLLPRHWYAYLNLLTKDPRAFIVSGSFKEKYGANAGDQVSVRWGDNTGLEGYIFAFIDFWPTYNPFSKEINTNAKDFIVANLSYINTYMRTEPYEIWLKLRKDVTTDMIYNDIKQKKLPIVNIQNTNQQIIAVKNDPLLQGTNGALTMGFIITMIICTIGFLIYWILSINRRTLQFGIFRAMGISLKEVLNMIILEQALISGTSIVMGIVSGGLASDLFIPLLQVIYGSSEQVPPFHVTAFRSDYYKLYLMIIIMLVVGFAVLGRLISKININQALKLGED